LEVLAIEKATQSIPKAECQKLFDEADMAETELKKGNVEPFFLSDRNLHQKVTHHSDNGRLIEIMGSLEVQVKWFGDNNDN
jgi:DNA-binding GntR family transcriptional regulator